MEEQEQPPATPADQPPETPAPHRMSLPARLLNVFAIPGEVFGDLKTAPFTLSNWLVPAVLGAVVGMVSAVLILSQPTIQKQFRERQTKFVEDSLKNKPLTPQERSMLQSMTQPEVLKTVAAAGAAVGSFGNVIWWGFVLWFLARRLLRVQVPFAKTLEVAGLAMMINVLGSIVAVLLIINLGRMGASASLALLVKDFDATRKGHLFAAAANLFSVWVVAVRAIGLAKLAGVSYLRAGWAVFTFWALEQLLLILSGLGQAGL